MKRTILALAFILAAASCAPAAAGRIVIGVSPFPHGAIARVAKDVLAKDGYTLEIREFTDYVTPNVALSEKSLDANFFQHVPYLENTVREKKFDLTWVAKVHIEPLGMYSKKIRNLEGLKPGDTVAIPNDPTNGARALRLLEKNGLVRVKAGDLVTVRDVTENPKSLRIVELDAPQLPRSLDDTAASVINTNFAVEAGLLPSRDAIVIEDPDSPYANVLAVRAGDRDSAAIRALVGAFTSPEVKRFIETELVPKGIVAAF